MMKSAFRCVQIVLLLFGVFGADEDEVKSVSVVEGDSVTLNTDLTQIKKFNLIQWRFGDQVIAKIDVNDISYPSHTEIFRDRLQLDQTGSLTIKNMKTKHSGLYKLQISHGSGTEYEKFSVTVYESVSDAGKSEMKSVSLMEGDRVTLQTDVTLSGDELIVWRFGDEGEVIAKADIEEAKSSPLYYDERFRDRLELEQTGSLTITNTRTTDSGHYAVKISSSRAQTVNKRFTVTISEPGLSPGDKVGIVVAVLLLVAAVAGAAAAVIYHRRQISELQKRISTVTVKEGGDVILKPNKEIKEDDVILWMFGDKKQQIHLSEINRKTGEIVTHDYITDERFRDKLKLDETTGSLTIWNSTTEHSGLYTLEITSSGVVSQQRFILTVNENVEVRSVEGGDSVTLNPDTEIQRDDQILWMFGDQEDIIARIKGGTVEIHDDAADERFRDRLELNETTGSLIIRNITPEHTGLYKLQIISSGGTFFKKFRVFMRLRHVPATVGKSVHMSTGLTKIERDDEIQWRFRDDSLIAEIKGGNGETYDVPDKRFRDGLQLDNHTGDLTIKNSTTEHAGRYKLKICSSKGVTNKTYIVIIGDFLGKRLNESVEMQPLNKEVPDGVNESATVEMRSLLDK